MAYVDGNLFAMVNAPPGRRLYRYDSVDDMVTVEVAGHDSRARRCSRPRPTTERILYDGRNAHDDGRAGTALRLDPG